jgi:predicted alpha/beta superfamily hydrolase
MRPFGPEAGARSRLRPSLLLVPVVLAGLVGMLLAAWWLEAWRGREQEGRLRRTHTVEGTVDRHPEFRSALLGTTRSVSVYLPRQYPIELDRRFPVLYVQDGQNIFDGATASVAGQEWQLDEAAERLIADGRIEPLIVVAIDNGGARRQYEYTPTPDRNRGDGGGADSYGRMLVEELKPWVDRSYRTRPGRESTGIAGSSLGGLVSLYVGLRHPGVFSRIASLSTSVSWDDGFIVRFLDALPVKPETLIWTDVGTKEEPPALAYARLLRDALVRKGWREGVDMRYLEATDARHDEAAWARRMPEVLAFLDPSSPAPSPEPSAPAAGAPARSRTGGDGSR